MRKIFFAHLAVLIAFLWIATSAVAQPWILRIVDDAGDTGYNSRIAVTSDGTPYILYNGQGKTYLAWWVSSGECGGGWNYRLVGGGNHVLSHRTTSLFADKDDNLHLAFSCTTNYPDTLYYALFDSNTKSWLIPPEMVVSDVLYAFYPALGVVDSSGTIIPTIAYVRDDSWELEWATRNSGVWSHGLICGISNAGRVLSMAVDSTGRLWLTFYERFSNLRYATRALGETIWECGYIDNVGNVGEYSSIAIDHMDVPHVVYYDADNGDLKYAKLIP